MWPFRRKDVATAPASLAPPAFKSATYLFSVGAGKAGLTGAGYDKLAAEGYVENVVAYSCINRIAASVASVEMQLYRKGKGDKLTKVDRHDLLDLMDNPNPAQSGKEFMRYLISYQQLAGDAFVAGNDGKLGNTRLPLSKPPLELQLLTPGKVKIESGDGYLPRFYEFKQSMSRTVTYPVDQIKGRSAILHLKSFNPLNAWYGMSPLAAAALGVDIHNDGQKWNKRLIENGARPSGALVVNGGGGPLGLLTDDQYDRVKSMIDEQFSGPSNVGRPMLLEGGLDWKEMSLNPKDMEFLEGKHSAARDIALAYGVPPQLLGIPGDSTFANYEMAKLAFWTDTVLPLLCWTLDAFNRWLTPLYGEDLYLWFDEDTIPALEPLRKQKAERINAAAYMTIDEKRNAMGLESLPDGIGQVVLVPATSIPLDLAGQVNLPEPGSPADGKDPNADPNVA